MNAITGRIMIDTADVVVVDELAVQGVCSISFVLVELLQGDRTNLDVAMSMKKFCLLHNKGVVGIGVFAAKVGGDQAWNGLFVEDQAIEDLFHRVDKGNGGIKKEALATGFFIGGVGGHENVIFQCKWKVDSFFCDVLAKFGHDLRSIRCSHKGLVVPDFIEFVLEGEDPFHQISRGGIFVLKEGYKSVTDSMGKAALVDLEEELVFVEIFHHAVFECQHRSGRFHVESEHQFLILAFNLLNANLLVETPTIWRGCGGDNSTMNIREGNGMSGPFGHLFNETQRFEL